MSHDHVDKDEVDDALAREPSAEEMRSVVEEISSHSPPPRLGTELVLLEVNPHRAHAYWTIDVEVYRSTQQRADLKNAPLVLRLFDITDGTPPERAMTAFDVEVQGLQGHWYLDLWKDGRTHVADIGFRAADGRLVALARSNAVSTPPAAESPDYHTLAVDTAQPDGPRITDLILDPHLSDENTDADSTVRRAPDEQPMPADWPSAERLERLAPAGVVSAPTPAVEPNPAPPAVTTPAPAPVPVPAATSVQLDQYVGLSSFEHGRREVALEVNVELHLYGRAKPGTELTLYGQPVPLRPDGTFSVRKPLPQGAVVLPLLAVDPPSASKG